MTPEDLIRWRKKHRITQVQAAIVFAVNRRTISAWELSETRIPKTVELACRYFDDHPREIDILLDPIPVTAA